MFHAAAILILKLKTTRILNYYFDFRNKKKNTIQKQEYENKLFALITLITTTLSFRQTASGCISEQTLTAFTLNC
jgi:hypothetical protein